MKLSTYAKRTGICYMTAWKMFHANQIPGSYRLPTGTIIVPDSAIPDPKNPDDKKDLKVCVYARVSSSQNKKNLDSQASRVEQFCSAKGWKVLKVVKETASGINDKRRKLADLISNIGKYDHIVVEHKDRLTRLGFNYKSSPKKAPDFSRGMNWGRRPTHSL